LFGNIIKKAHNTTNLNRKSYTPNINEQDKTLIIKAFVYVDEFDNDTSNNYATKMIIVKNKDYSKDIIETPKSTKASTSSSNSQITKKPTPKIKSFYTRTKIFEEGKEITLTGMVDNDVNAFIVNGNKSHKLNVSQGKFEYKTNLSAENSNYTLELFKNGKKIEEKKLNFNITKTDAQKSSLSDSALSEEKINTLSTSDYNNTESVINQKKSQIINPTTLYESDGEKNKTIINYAMLGLSIVFNVILIWKRWKWKKNKKNLKYNSKQSAN